MAPPRHHAPWATEPDVRVTLFGMGLNVLLIIAKLAGGFLSGSIALIADGIHSGSDLATDFVVISGIHLGTRKADASHAYGHGRYETIAGGIVAASLVLVGGYIMWDAGVALCSHRLSHPGLSVVFIAAASIIAKEWVARWTLRVAKKVHSPALRANAWHHRSDALSSIAVLIGGAINLLGWGHADQAAGIVVGGMVIAAGIRTVVNVLHELTEGSLPPSTVERITEAITETPGVRGFHNLRTRRVGREVFIDLHVFVDPRLSVLAGHSISMDVEQAIKRVCSESVHVLIHIEPDIPEIANLDLND